MRQKQTHRQDRDVNMEEYTGMQRDGDEITQRQSYRRRDETHSERERKQSFGGDEAKEKCWT